MQNYAEHEDDKWGNLQVKIFNGPAGEVEAAINQWLEDIPISIEKTLQSESGDADNFWLSITIFYIEEGIPRFVSKDWGISQIAQFVEKYLENNWCITIAEIQDYLFKKKEKKP